MKRLLPILIGLAVVIAAVIALKTIPSESAWIGSKSPSDVVEEVLPGVVNISALTLVRQYSYYGTDVDEFFRFFGMPFPQASPRTTLGSGFIISKDGEVLTNNHVVERADEVYVILASGVKHKAKILGRDSKLDIALLKIDVKEKFTPLTMGDSDKIRIAEDVYAIGNPFGLSHSVSKGIISAKHRSLGEGPFDDFIQTDAAINFGNSGGPLIDDKGEVIGISTAMKARSQGLGFAIPVNLVRPVLDQLREFKKVLRSWLGIAGQDVRANIGNRVIEGVGVAQIVRNSPAHLAGLGVGDVIVDIEGKGVSSSDGLQRLLNEYKPKKRIVVRVFRNGQYIQRAIVLDEFPAEDQLPSGYEFM